MPPARHPTLQALLRHRTIVLLLVMQVALACAVSANTLLMTVRNLAAMQLDSGMDERSIVVLAMPDAPEMPDANRAENLARLRRLPGATGVVAMQGFPFGIDITGTVARDSDGGGAVPTSLYGVTPGAIDTLGLRLAAGRDFAPEEFPDTSAGGSAPATAAIVSGALARHLFGGMTAALGRIVQLDGQPLRIVGAVEHLVRAQPLAGETREANGYSLLVPAAPTAPLGVYAIRAEPGAERRVAAEASRLFPPDRGTGIPGTLEDARQAYFARSRADTTLLAVATTAFLVVTAVGIWGLSLFWVRRRTRAFGILRALGASRYSVVRGLLLENALVVAIGNAAGVPAALATNRWLAAHAGLGPLPAIHLGIAFVLLWLLGASAAFVPALRAASLPPAAVLRIS